MAVMQRELRYPMTVHRRPVRHGWRTGAVATLVACGLALWLAYTLTSAALAWGQLKLDDLRYGYPRTFQMDGYLGYAEASGLPTHFTVINAHRQVLILIVPGTDPAHVSVIRGPYLYGADQDFSPATLALRDVNNDGAPDLVLRVAGQTFTYLNDPSHHSFYVAHAGTGAAQ